MSVLYVGSRERARELNQANIFMLSLASAASAHAYIRDHQVSSLVLDFRDAELPFAESVSGRLLRKLFPEGHLYAPIRRERIVALVPNGCHGVDIAYHLGGFRIGVVLAEPTLEQIRETVERGRETKAGKVAICLAGGGIEGLLYELGVLRALSAVFPRHDVTDFDLFYGISAGAILASFLANGVGPDEIADGLSGRADSRITAIRRRDLFDPNFAEVAERLWGVGKRMMSSPTDLMNPMSVMSRMLPTGAFSGDGLRRWLEENLNQEGLSDDFSSLAKPLFVGATDQDTSQAVVFGTQERMHVPIHQAVRASAALAPFYAPEEIEGRFYIDGAFTRTTNMRVAVEHGATLVILVDPLVPVFSDEAGYVHTRGGLYGAMQALKTMINGRFDKAARAIREMYPDVSFYLFRPYGKEMRMLGGSPMKYFYREEIEEVAFRHSSEVIRRQWSEMQRDFARHGFEMRDPQRNELVA